MYQLGMSRNHELKQNKKIKHHRKKYDNESGENSEENESEENQSEEESTRNHRSKKDRRKNESASSEDEESDTDTKHKRIRLEEKTKEHLKNKLNNWLDYDDKIKELNKKIKKYKDEKKQQEEFIIKVITNLGIGEKKIDVQDKNNQFRSRVYRHKSITKAALKDNIIKDALMEAIRDEKKVDHLIKKIDSKRPINERYYLKRTKGNKN